MVDNSVTNRYLFCDIKKSTVKYWIKAILDWNTLCPWNPENEKDTPLRGNPFEIPFCDSMISEGTSDDLDLANWQAEMPTVQEISKSMQNFSTPDYIVFAAMLIACSGVGIYFGFVKKSSGEDEYLVGGRNMKTFPVSLSLIASFISGRILYFYSFIVIIFYCYRRTRLSYKNGIN